MICGLATKMWHTFFLLILSAVKPPTITLQRSYPINTMDIIDTVPVIPLNKNFKITLNKAVKRKVGFYISKKQYIFLKIL